MIAHPRSGSRERSHSLVLRKRRTLSLTKGLALRLASALAAAPSANAADPSSPPDTPVRAESQSPEPAEEPIDLSRFFPDADATFVVLDEAAQRVTVHNAARAATRFHPCSTFKVPHALIALETGVADSPSHRRLWDAERYPPEDWWPKSWSSDHTLASAIQHSAVWYFRETARAIGPERMQHWLDRLDYGNADISGPPDLFWLEGGLKIAPVEQIEFFRRLYHDALPASPENQARVREMIRLQKDDTGAIHGKTGSGREDDGSELAWLVGWQEPANGSPRFFALNLGGQSIWTRWPPHERLALVQQLLETTR